MKAKLWTKDYVILLISSLFLYIGFQIFMPTLPAQIIKLGGTETQASLAVGLFSLVALFMRVIAGGLNDRFGAKIMILVGFFVLIAVTVNFYWSTVVSALLVLRLFHGVGWGITTALGMSLAPIIAIILMNQFSFHFLIGFSIMLMVLVFLLVTRLKMPKQEIVVKHKMQLFDKGALLPALLCMLMAFPLGGIQTFMMIYGLELHVRMVWIFFVGQAIMVLVSRVFAGRLYDLKGHRVVILPGIVLMGLGLWWLSLATGAWSLFGSSLFFGLGYGMVQPSLQALAVDRAAPDKKGIANGTFLSGMDVGMALGSFGLSFIAAHYNYAMMYRWSIVTLVIFLVVYLIVFRTKRLLPGK